MKFPIKKSLLIKQTAAVVGLIVVVSFLTVPISGIILGNLLNPVGGMWNGMYYAEYPEVEVVSGSGYTGTVYRDQYAIPHVFCERTVDMGYILGYLQARDRLFSMDMQRRLISGQLASLLGPGDDNENIEADKLMRLFGFRRLGENMWNKILELAPTDPEVQEMKDVFTAYCAGVNKFISECQLNKLPLEYVYLNIQPYDWSPVDIMILAKYMSFSLCYQDSDLDMTIIADKLGKDVVRELIPEGPFDFEDVVIPNFTSASDAIENPIMMMSASSMPDDFTFINNAAEQAKVIKTIMNKMDTSIREMIQEGCSNNWVVNGSLTDSGYPILCGDPHLPLMVPSIWWVVNVVNISNPTQSFYGVCFPGTPMIQIGFNQYCAWSATVTAVDVSDFYYENFTNDYSKYWNGSYERDVETISETIYVKGSAPVIFDIIYTKHDYNQTDDFLCPVIPSGLSGNFKSYTNISIKSTYMLNDIGILRTFMRLPRCLNVTDYLEALEPYAYPGQNFIFADVWGNIALYPRAFYPMRNMSGSTDQYFREGDDPNGEYRGRFILNGSTGEDEWAGYIPFDWVPHKINPDQCFLVSANQRTVNTTEYPLYLGYGWADTYRGSRINQLIKARIAIAPNITVEDMRAFQSDVYDLAAQYMVPYLLEAAEDFYGGLATGMLNATLEILEAWNNSANPMQYRMFRNLTAPTIFDHWFSDYRNATFADEYIDNGIYGLTMYPQEMCLQNLTMYDQESHWFNRTDMAGDQYANWTMLWALNETIADLTTDLGSTIETDWLWGNVHIMKIEYLQGMLPAFDYPMYGCDGSARTVNVAPGPYVRHGPSERMIVDFERLNDSSDLYPALLTVPSGQNGNPASSHYSDLFELWKVYEYPPCLFPRVISDYPTSSIFSRVIFS